MADWSVGNYGDLINNLNDRLAQATPKLDPSLISGLFDAYKSGRDYAYEQRNREAFKGGVPTDAAGNPDYSAIFSKTLTMGGTPAVKSAIDLANVDLLRRQLVHSEASSRELSGMPPAPAGPVGVGVQPLPPSTSNAGLRPTAPSTAAMGNGAQAAPGTTINGIGTPSIATIFTEALGDAAKPVLENLAKFRPGVDLEAPLKNPQEVAAVTQNAQRMAQARNGGGVAPAGAVGAPAPLPAPPPANPAATGPAPAQTFAQPAPVAQIEARFPGANGAPPPAPVMAAEPIPSTDLDPRAQAEINRLTRIAADPNNTKTVQEAAKVRLEAVLKRYERTNEQKNYDLYQRQGGRATFEEFVDKENRDKQEMQVLEKAVIPRVTASLEKATAARDDILAIHNARQQLDEDKGILSGALANNKLALQKAGALFGFSNQQVANTESFKIAIAERVKSIIKAFGSGTGLSEGDRKYANAMAAGDITLDEKSIRRVLDIGEKANRVAIDRHEMLLNRVAGSNPAFSKQRDTFTVELPGQYKPGKTQQAAPAASEPKWMDLGGGVRIRQVR